MPNQSDPNQNQPVAPPIASIQADLPPLPPDFQSEASGTPVAPPINPPPDSAAPPGLSPIISSKPKKKFGTGRIIATILGIFILVGGVGAGIIQIQQPSFFQELAAGTKSWRDIGSPKAGRHAGKIEFEKAQKASYDLQQQQQSGNTSATGPVSNFLPTRYSDPNYSGPPPQGTYAVYAEGASSGSIVGYRYIDAPGVFAGAVNRAANGSITDLELLSNTYHMTQTDLGNANDAIGNGLTWVPPGVGGIDYWHWTACIDTGTNGVGCGTGGEEIGGGGGDDATTTDTASCSNVKAYSSTWTLLTSAQLSALAPDTVVNFCVAGTASAGVFDKAQFKIGTTLGGETTTPRPGATNEFCQSYTIKSTDTTINVKAKINHTTLGWQGEAI